MDPDRRRVLKSLSGGAMAAVLTSSPAEAGVAANKAAKRIRVGQIGVGHPHASKLGVYRESADYEVVGIVEPDAELRARAEAQDVYRGVPWMTREQLLNAPGLQAVLVETQVRDLLEAAEACVSAGKHVHIDKPAGESLPRLRRLLDGAARQKLLVQMGYMYRYNPGVVLLREFLKKGWLGEPFEVHAVMSKVIAPADRRRVAEYPGGIMFDLGSHLVDLVVGLLGKPKTVTAFSQHAARQDDPLLDNMLSVFTYDRAVATLKSSAMEVEGFGRRHLVLCGTEGTFHIQPLDDPAARVALSQARGAHRRGYQDLTFPRYTRYVDDAADMAKIIRGEKAADFSYDHDLTVQDSLFQACGLPVDR